MNIQARRYLGPRLAWVAAMVFGVIALMLAAGCQSPKLAAPEEDLRARNMPVPDGKGLVYVMLPESIDVGRTVWVNYEQVGMLGSSNYLVLEAEPGDLLVHMVSGNEIVWRRIMVETDGRHYLRFRKKIGLSPWSALTALVGVVVTNAELSIDVLDDSDGPRTLKCCKLTQVVTVIPPSAAEWQEKTRDVLPGRALVHLFRSTWAESEMRYVVLVGKEPLGSIGAHSFRLMDLVPGRHRLALIDPASGDEVSELLIEVVEDRRYYVSADPGGAIRLESVDVEAWDATMENLRLARAAER